MSARCRIEECGRNIPGDLFLCSKHWKLLSPEFRMKVLKAKTISTEERENANQAAVLFVQGEIDGKKQFEKCEADYGT